ncbi:MAG TPA: hypothetical protein VIL49_15445, partial [Capillimicrobium sp.]
VIATASRLAEIADDVRDAIDAGSNVLTSAEEAADPWAADAGLADDLHARARAREVSVLGAGLNPGFAFDALVLTATGACAEVRALSVQRVVDLSGFGAGVLRRIGVGHEPSAFANGVASGAISGHVGFPQSMRLVARALGLTVDRVDREIEPTFARQDHWCPHLRVARGQTAGFRQRYVAVVDGQPWFEALFCGHVAPATAGLVTRDAITVDADPPVTLEIPGGLNAQSGSAAVLANSVTRVAAAPPGWVTVAELPPAVPIGRAGRLAV